MSASFYDLLKFAKTGIASPSMTAYDKQKALAMCKAGFPVKTITGTPPISFKSDGTALTAWSISGNMTQSGTPTPSAPIQPQECGDRTRNLAPEIRNANGWVIGYRNSATGSYISNNGYGEWLSPKIKILAGETFTISAMHISPESMSVYFWNGDTYLSNASKTDYSGSTFTAPEGTTQIDFAIRAGSDKKTEAAIISSGFWVMLNTGSTALPYEPFGYKIPITLAGQTQNIYLSEPLRKIGGYCDTVEQDGTVTRRIEKLVLTGTENWTLSGTDANRVVCQMPITGAVYISGFCTHILWKTSYSTEYNRVTLSSSGGGTLYISIENTVLDTEDAAGFKTFLAAQYSAGTPVTVWYVLATAVTEQTTVPTLTPTKGSNTLSIGTTLAPSSVSITGGIK